MKTLNNFEVREKIKPTATNFLLTCTFGKGPVNKKTLCLLKAL